MLKGNIILKGDKSISHRILIFAALSEGECTINNLSTCKDVQRTVNILKQCNIMINNSGNGETAIKGSKLSSNSKKSKSSIFKSLSVVLSVASNLDQPLNACCARLKI